MDIRRWVVRFFTHTRFVPTPLYRLMVAAWLISGVLQLVYDAPNSVRQTAHTIGWFDWAFVAAQLISAVLVLVGLYFIEENTRPIIDPELAAIYTDRLRTSLTLEMVGCIGLQTVVAVQVAATIYYQGRIPSSGTTWMAIIFAAWMGFRQRDILRDLKRLEP